MRIVFFGTPEFARPSLEALISSTHRVVAVVTQPDRPRGRGHRTSDSPIKRVARAAAVPTLQPDRLKDEGFLSTLRGLDADLGVVAAYGRILPDAALTTPKRGMINVHASLLPKYRGAAPVHRAVMAGDAVTGVTIMRVVAALDAGPILARRERPIGPDETSEEVERALAQLGAALLVESVDDLASGKAVEQPQDDSASSYAPRLTKADGEIDWSKPARHIHDQVRGLYPWPHAFAFLGGERLIVLKTAWDPPRLADAEPGTIVEARGDVLSVVAGDGVILQLVEVQPEGRRGMRAREFLSGHPLTPGRRFTRSTAR